MKDFSSNPEELQVPKGMPDNWWVVLKRRSPGLKRFSLLSISDWEKQGNWEKHYQEIRVEGCWGELQVHRKGPSIARRIRFCLCWSVPVVVLVVTFVTCSLEIIEVTSSSLQLLPYCLALLSSLEKKGGGDTQGSDEVVCAVVNSHKGPIRAFLCCSLWHPEGKCHPPAGGSARLLGPASSNTKTLMQPFAQLRSGTKGTVKTEMAYASSKTSKDAHCFWLATMPFWGPPSSPSFC